MPDDTQEEALDDKVESMRQQVEDLKPNPRNAKGMPHPTQEEVINRIEWINRSLRQDLKSARLLVDRYDYDNRKLQRENKKLNGKMKARRNIDRLNELKEKLAPARRRLSKAFKY